MFRAEKCTHTPANGIFSRSHNNLLSVRCVFMQTLSRVMRKSKQQQNTSGFEISLFDLSFSSDIMAVKELTANKSALALAIVTHAATKSCSSNCLIAARHVQLVSQRDDATRRYLCGSSSLVSRTACYRPVTIHVSGTHSSVTELALQASSPSRL